MTVLPQLSASEAALHSRMNNQLSLGVLSEATRTQLRAVLARLVEQGAEAVVLGCTELALLLGSDDCAVPLLLSARLQVEAAVAHAFSGF